SHDDVPFVVDSTRMAINRHGYLIHFIIHLGGMRVERDANGQLQQIYPPTEHKKEAATSAPIYIEIDKIADEISMQALRDDIVHVLSDVRIAVADWRKMVRRIEEAI